jgi:Ca2+-binding EF-hand superfamily protein
MMNDLDADSDGLISRQETMRPANEEGTHTLLFDSATSLILRPDYSEILFKAADRNKDGWLAESEMTAYLNPLYEAHMHRALAHDIIEEMKRRMGAAELKIRDLVSQSKLLQKKANEYAVLMDGTANVNVLVPLLRALALEKSQQISQHYFEVADSDQVGESVLLSLWTC